MTAPEVLTFVPIEEALADPATREDLDGFDAGDQSWDARLTNYLRFGNAAREHRARVNSTYLAYDVNGRFVGYVTLSYLQVELTADVKAHQGLRKIPYASISALLLSRLAVHRAHQSRGLGGTIVSWVVDVARALPAACRFVALHVDAENKRAIRFYERQQFVARGDVRHGLQLLLRDLLTPL